MARKSKQNKTLSLLLSGKHPEYKKYAGKHVMVINDNIVPIKEGKESRKQFKKMKEDYGKSPILTFVPRSDISYIL